MNYFHTCNLLMSLIIPSLPSFVTNYTLIQLVQVSIQCYLDFNILIFFSYNPKLGFQHIVQFNIPFWLLFVCFFLPGSFYHFHILSVPLAMRCFVPLSSSTKESLHHHLPFLDKHLIIQSQLHTCDRKMSSTVFQRFLLVILKLGMLFVRRPCWMLLCTCSILKKIHKQILAK